MVLHHCAGAHARGNDNYRDLPCFLQRFLPARLRGAGRDPGGGCVCGGCRFLTLWDALKRRNRQIAWGGIGWPEFSADRAPHRAIPRGGRYVGAPGIVKRCCTVHARRAAAVCMVRAKRRPHSKAGPSLPKKARLPSATFFGLTRSHGGDMVLAVGHHEQRGQRRLPIHSLRNDTPQPRQSRHLATAGCRNRFRERDGSRHQKKRFTRSLLHPSASAICR